MVCQIRNFRTGSMEYKPTFTLFPDTKNYYHGLLWQLNNHHTTGKSSLMLSQHMDVFLVQKEPLHTL